MKTSDRQAYKDMMRELDDSDCVVFQEYPSDPTRVFFGKKQLCIIGEKSGHVDWHTAWRMVKDEMEHQRYWPNIYHVNERGNVDLLDYDGNTIQSWV